MSGTKMATREIGMVSRLPLPPRTDGELQAHYERRCTMRTLCLMLTSDGVMSRAMQLWPTVEHDKLRAEMDATVADIQRVSAESLPTLVREARHRIRDHIAAARDREEFGAVSSLEKLLARIEGTESAVKVQVEVAPLTATEEGREIVSMLGRLGRRDRTVFEAERVLPPGVAAEESPAVLASEVTEVAPMRTVGIPEAARAALQAAAGAPETAAPGEDGGAGGEGRGEARDGSAGSGVDSGLPDWL